MKKRLASFLIMSFCLCQILSGCKSKDTSKKKASTKTITLLNGQAEVKAQIEELAEAYTKKTGVKVKIETPEAGVDIQATLKGYYLADKMPDIFAPEALPAVLALI